MEASPPFELHCTLLYNFKPPKECHTKQEKECYGNQMLDECWTLYQERMKSTRSDDDQEERNIVLNPTSYYYFPYPKEADNGQGFGCVISLLLLENTDELNGLHKAAMDTFPPDERHCNAKEILTDGQDLSVKKSHDNNAVQDPEEDATEEPETKDEDGKFVPHMALIYAPEMYGETVQTYTEEELKVRKSHLLKPFKGHWLSLWSTEGQLEDWYLIARRPLL